MGSIGTRQIVKLFDLQDKDKVDCFEWKVRQFIHKCTYPVFEKWGTTYKVLGVGIDLDD